MTTYSAISVAQNLTSRGEGSGQMELKDRCGRLELFVAGYSPKVEPQLIVLVFKGLVHERGVSFLK